MVGKMFTHFFLYNSTVIDKPPRPAQPSLLYLVVRDLSYLRKFTLLQFTADKLKIDYIMLAKKVITSIINHFENH